MLETSGTASSMELLNGVGRLEGASPFLKQGQSVKGQGLLHQPFHQRLRGAAVELLRKVKLHLQALHLQITKNVQLI